MGMIGETISASCQLSLGYAERLLTNVSATDFGKFARPGGQLVESNHPAFIYGHLSLYAPRIISELGQDPGDLQPSDEYVKLFSHEAKCLDDPEGTLYPAMDELTTRFLDGYRQANRALRVAADSILTQENPEEKSREKFPTIGAKHGFYVGGHVMIHMGQLSAWRRAMGLGPA